MNKYLFTSERLGFRNWLPEDLDVMSEINADPGVMEFFPATQSRTETASFIQRMQAEFLQKGFCYFAVDTFHDNGLVGFIGLSEKTFEADFTPCVDIGWRLHRKAWNKGYATEGAKRCLNYAFNDLHLDKVYSMAPVVNIKSIQVMQKIGMKKVKSFLHPLLHDNLRLQECLLYEIERHMI